VYWAGLGTVEEAELFPLVLEPELDAAPELDEPELELPELPEAGISEWPPEECPPLPEELDPLEEPLDGAPAHNSLNLLWVAAMELPILPPSC